MQLVDWPQMSLAFIFKSVQYTPAQNHQAEVIRQRFNMIQRLAIRLSARSELGTLLGRSLESLSYRVLAQTPVQRLCFGGQKLRYFLIISFNRDNYHPVVVCSRGYQWVFTEIPGPCVSLCSYSSGALDPRAEVDYLLGNYNYSLKEIDKACPALPVRQVCCIGSSFSRQPCYKFD